MENILFFGMRFECSVFPNFGRKLFFFGAKNELKISVTNGEHIMLKRSVRFGDVKEVVDVLHSQKLS